MKKIFVTMGVFVLLLGCKIQTRADNMPSVYVYNPNEIKEMEISNVDYSKLNIDPAILEKGDGWWTQSDTMNLIGTNILYVLDWGTTRDIAMKPERYEEINPILGKHPSVQSVDQYFAVCIAGNSLITYLLPPKYRKIWQFLGNMIEGYCVTHNLSIGLSVHF